MVKGFNYTAIIVYPKNIGVKGTIIVADIGSYTIVRVRSTNKRSCPLNHILFGQSYTG